MGNGWRGMSCDYNERVYEGLAVENGMKIGRRRFSEDEHGVWRFCMLTDGRTPRAEVKSSKGV